MQSLNKKDAIILVKRIPKELRDMMKSYREKIFIAGGFIRSVIMRERINDIDVFCKDWLSAKEMATEYSLKFSPAAKVTETKNAFTVHTTIRVQFIQKWDFKTPADIITAFDFVLACAAIWYDDSSQWETVCHDEYYQDLSAKRVTYLAPIREEDSAGSFVRAIKFRKRGYHTPPDSMGAILARVVKKAPMNIQDSTERELGVAFEKMLMDVYPSSQRS